MKNATFSQYFKQERPILTVDIAKNLVDMNELKKDIF